MKFCILIKPYAVYVKTFEFFSTQGGLTELWGKGWLVIKANDVESARSIGYRLRDEFGLEVAQL